jgi:fatty acid-binding protein DegV
MREFSLYFIGVGQTKIGTKCVISGATSDVREGVVLDEIVEHLDEHDQQTKTVVVVDKSNCTFGQEGDSIGLQGG